MGCFKKLFQQTFRFVLFILNSLLVLFSIAMIVMAIIYVVKNTRDTDDASDAVPVREKWFNICCSFTLSMGFIILLICIPIGYYYGIHKERKLCLIMYCVLLIIIGVVGLIMGVLMFAVHSDNRKDAMQLSFKSYEEHKEYLENIQNRYHCCGPYPDNVDVSFKNIKHCSGGAKRTDCVTAFDEAYSTYQSNLGAMVIIGGMMGIVCGILGLMIWRIMRKAATSA